jgi:hypothetical protein
MCSNCGKPITDTSIRFFIDSEKMNQICKTCWEKECKTRFAKTAHKQVDEVLQDLKHKFGYHPQKDGKYCPTKVDD